MSGRCSARAALAFAAVSAALGLAPQSGRAMTPPRTLAARLKPDAAFGSCTTTYTSVAFGAYDEAAPGATTAAGSVGFTCTGFVFQMNVTISAGSSNNAGQRTMTDGAGHALLYNLYLPSGGVWGDGSAAFPNGYTVNFPASGTPYAATISGSIPAKQTTLPAGSYNDAPVVTFSSI